MGQIILSHSLQQGKRPHRVCEGHKNSELLEIEIRRKIPEKNLSTNFWG